ncbi:Histone-lysine N-methyltransferase SETMAR [Eumeta japonica]|uniref:Histone-lysine N-methyltransferase SETMAR n=1 Tax=Eumeta variegata TaxID=151549 RepID=A0A4C1UJ70_EUMVA|nr:Histone-lysine N-methyltransferase SETMAR [Eumeta japonica]
MTVFAQGAAATPVPLLNAMTEVGRRGALRDVRVVHMHTECEAPYVAPECKDIFRCIPTMDRDVIQYMRDLFMVPSPNEKPYSFVMSIPESSNLSNIEHRAVIKYFVKKGKTSKDIFEDMVSVLQETAPSYTMVEKWARLFQQGRVSCEDDPRPGHPVTIAEELQISKERVGEIIHELMNMRKISARWVPKMLTPFDKQRRLQTSKDFLELVGDNIDEICDRIVTVDETWVRQYDPESKQESMQWTKKGERPPKKFKVQKSASKLMATIFWDSEGVLLIEYLPKGTTMNGQYYTNLLAQAREAVVQKRRGKLSRGVLFLQDNASVHTARVSRQALKDTGLSEIDHLPYSPDLAPSDYFLFSNLKKELRGRRFVDDNQMKMAVESHFDCKEKEYFLGGLKALYTRLSKSPGGPHSPITPLSRLHSFTIALPHQISYFHSRSRVKDVEDNRSAVVEVFGLCCRSCSLFMAANVRKAVAEGRSDAIPIFLQDIPKLFHRKIIQPDIALIQVSPPDQHGYCSLGTSVDCVRSALVNSKTIIGEATYIYNLFEDLVHLNPCYRFARLRYS